MVILYYIRTYIMQICTLRTYVLSCVGGSVDKLICDFGSFDEAVIIKYLKQIMFGVGYLHEHRAIHRDIKGTHVYTHTVYSYVWVHILYICMTLYGMLAHTHSA